MFVYQQIDEVDVAMYRMVYKYFEVVHKEGTKPQDYTFDKMIAYISRNIRTGGPVHRWIWRMDQGAQYDRDTVDKVDQQGLYVAVPVVT